MSKIRKLVEGTSNLLRKPYLINLILEDQEVNKAKLLDRYDFPKGLPVVEMASLSNETTFELNPYTFLEGGSLPTDYMLLCLLAKKFDECSYFEIGTWRGESAANVSRYAKEIFTLNLSEQQMLEKGWDEKYIRLHGFFSKKIPSVNHLYGDSLQFDFAKWKNSCDLVFIDGDHHYESVKKDTENCFSLLRDENSIIVWHDYGLSTETTRWEVLRGILDGMPKEKHQNLFAVKNTLCAIYYPHKIDSYFSDFPETPKYNFKLNIQIEKI